VYGITTTGCGKVRKQCKFGIAKWFCQYVSYPVLSWLVLKSEVWLLELFAYSMVLMGSADKLIKGSAGQEREDRKMYQSTIGSLIFISQMMCPDIMFAVHQYVMINCTHHCMLTTPTPMSDLPLIALTPLRLCLLRALSRLLHPDTITFRGRNTMHTQHSDNKVHKPFSPKFFLCCGHYWPNRRINDECNLWTLGGTTHHCSLPFV
jgi:hypothetical protein